MKKRILVLLKSKQWTYVGTSYNCTSIAFDTDDCRYVVTVNDLSYAPSVRVVKIVNETGKTYECFHISFSILFSRISRALFLKAYRKVNKVRKHHELAQQVEVACVAY